MMIRPGADGAPSRLQRRRFLWAILAIWCVVSQNGVDAMVAVRAESKVDLAIQ